MRRCLPPVAAVLALVLLAVPGVPTSGAPRASLAAFRGLGAWVDIYDDALLADPQGSVAAMAAQGVRTLYLETSNFTREQDVVWPEATAGLIEAAHAAGLRVVAWYLPGFQNLARDFRRSMAAVGFETPAGQGFDAFALDIEASVVADPDRRSARLLALSERVREAVGPSYPLGAIVPNPVRLELYPDRWPSFPWADLARIYDAFLPMDYFGYDVEGRRAAHDYTTRAVEIIREGTGDPTVPIHAIGGIARGLDGPEVEGFVQAVREHGLLGASLYDLATSGPEDWARLAAVPVNPRQSPALPVEVGYPKALGNLDRGDRTHPKEVVYRAGPMPGSWRVSFEVYDAQPGEVTLLVNWRPVAEVRGRRGAWSRRSLVVSDADLRDRGANLIQFMAVGDFPDWSVWGVRRLRVETA